MSNEEIIKEIRNLADKHKYDSVLTFGTNYHMAFTDIANHIEELADENTKLKAEIEQLKESRGYLSDVNGSLVRINDKQDREITKLKDEIEQLKRLSDQQSELNIEQFKQIDNQYQEIEQLNGIISRDMDKHECYVISKSIEVNNLKIEIEQLKSELEQWQSTNLKLSTELTRVECENHQLEVYKKKAQYALSCSVNAKKLMDSLEVLE